MYQILCLTPFNIELYYVKKIEVNHEKCNCIQHSNLLLVCEIEELSQTEEYPFQRYRCFERSESCARYDEKIRSAGSSANVDQ